MRNCYEILQVFPSASVQEIKDSFRLLLFRYHPDHNKDREDWAVKKTMELVEAYHILADSFRRAHHDVMRTVKLREAEAKKGGLKSLFGKSRQQSKEADALFKLGVDSYRAEEYEQAIQAFRRVWKLTADYPGVRYNMAVSFLAIERLSDASQWLQEHIGKNKEDAEARGLLSRVASLIQKKRGGGKAG